MGLLKKPIVPFVKAGFDDKENLFFNAYFFIGAITTGAL